MVDSMIDGDDSGDGDSSDGGESDSSAVAVNGRSFDSVTHGRCGRFWCCCHLPYVVTAKTCRSLDVRLFLPLEVRCRVIRTHFIRGRIVVLTTHTTGNRLVVKGVPLFRPTPLL